MNLRTTSYKSIIIALYCLLLMQTAFAANQYIPNLYQINLIVFEHITPKALASEQWQAVTTPTLSNTLQPQLLDTKEFQLKTELYRLKNAKNYKILYAASWQQYIPVTRRAKPIRIQTEKIDGTLLINRLRYFGTHLNLQLTEPHSYLDPISNADYASGIINSPSIIFQLKQSRRLKSGDLHYFDHPLFGVLLKVTKVLKNAREQQHKSQEHYVSNSHSQGHSQTHNDRP